MKNAVFLLTLLLMASGCKDNSTIVSPNEKTAGNFQYTLRTTKSRFGIHDTLSATVTITNTAVTPETLVVGMSLFNWELANKSGTRIMYGPSVSNWVLTHIPFNGLESRDIYSIHQAITNSSGMPVTDGVYVLVAKVDSVPLSMNVSIQ